VSAKLTDSSIEDKSGGFPLRLKSKGKPVVKNVIIVRKSLSRSSECIPALTMKCQRKRKIMTNK